MEEHYAIYVYGDSLGLPRTRDGVPYYDTYPELLRDEAERYDPTRRTTVFNRSQGGGFVSGLLSSFVNDGAYFGRDGSCILVIQCGIVDCAPRPVPMGVRTMIGRLPKALRWLVARFLHHARPFLLRAGMSWRQTTPAQFEAALREWLRRAAPRFDQIYVVNIAPTVQSVATHSPGLRDSIDVFNGVIAAAVRGAGHANAKVIDVHSAVSRSPLGISNLINEGDGHHITRLGHRLYADLIWAEEHARLRSVAGRAPETQSLAQGSALPTRAQVDSGRHG